MYEVKIKARAGDWRTLELPGKSYSKEDAEQIVEELNRRFLNLPVIIESSD